MANVENLESDLRYVKGAIAQRESGGNMPLSISIYWAIAMAAGFSLIDFAPQYTGMFWLIAGPLGFVYSIFAGRRDALAAGERDTEGSGRIVKHFAVLMLAIFLSPLLLIGGAVSPEGLGRVILLIVAMAYLLAAVHFERGIYLAAAVLFAGYIALAFLHTYAWTAIGILGGIALLASSFVGKGRASVKG